VMGQVRSLPGDCALAPPAAARTSFAPGGAPSRRESTLTVGALVGGSGGRHSQGAVLVGGCPGGALHVTFCPGRGAETAPRRPAPQRSSSTSLGWTTVASSYWPHLQRQCSACRIAVDQSENREGARFCRAHDATSVCRRGNRVMGWMAPP
jgi:hypothetical protein